MAWEIHMKVLVNKSTDRTLTHVRGTIPTDRTLTHVRGTILWWGEACAGWLVKSGLWSQLIVNSSVISLIGLNINVK